MCFWFGDLQKLVSFLVWANKIMKEENGVSFSDKLLLIQALSHFIIYFYPPLPSPPCSFASFSLLSIQPSYVIRGSHSVGARTLIPRMHIVRGSSNLVDHFCHLECAFLFRLGCAHMNGVVQSL